MRSVSDETLPKYGEIILDLISSESVRNVKVQKVSTETLVVTAIDGYFTDSDGESNPVASKTIEYTGADITLYVDSNVTSIKFSNKKGIKVLNSEYLDIKLEELKYAIGLTSLTLSNSFVSGDIAALGGLSNLRNLSISKTDKIYGNIETLKNLHFAYFTINPLATQTITGLTGNIEVALQGSGTSFRSIYIYRSPNIIGNVTDAIGTLIGTISFSLEGTAVGGDLKDLADAWYAAGRTSGNCSAYGNPGVMLFDGEPMPSRGVKFTFSSSGWTSENL